MEKINICGIPHTIEYVIDGFGDNSKFGEIIYPQARILINQSLEEHVKLETICHEIIHGILLHIGQEELSNDESFVDALSNAIYQSFVPNIHFYKDSEEDI